MIPNSIQSGDIIKIIENEQNGSCGNGATACTDPKLNNGWSTITIDPNVNSQATDLSIARTIMHEVLHAYLLFETQFPSDCDLNCLLSKYIIKYGSNDLNPTHHNLFLETKFLNDIAFELQNFAVSMGYNPNTLGGDQFFKDMAWGGLTSTNVFNSLPSS